MTGDRIAILIVCHANVCRSPMAERVFRGALDDQLGAGGAVVEMLSAGTAAWTARPMHPFARAVLSEQGLDGTDFRSQRLTPALVARSDLVLTATRGQRAAVVGMEPAAVRRSFTLPQFGRLTEAVAATGPLDGDGPVARLASLVERVPMMRGQLPVPPAEEDEIPDPIGRPIEVFRRCAGDAQRVAEVLARVIAANR